MRSRSASGDEPALPSGAGWGGVVAASPPPPQPSAALALRGLGEVSRLGGGGMAAGVRAPVKVVPVRAAAKA